ncbi:hypothetical protein Fmac_020504 [Flemingia macrophylla]|uniref:Cyclopropane-fatty-acyl-phospholipid synthase n=1 Tax=Flemingia macrophylla TaxID=520843 RepID=A0ABD1LUA7_9FABA
MRIAVVGGGISGLASAYALAKEGVNVVLYEKEDRLGGHAKTINVDGVDVDLAFMLFNQVYLIPDRDGDEMRITYLANTRMRMSMSFMNRDRDEYYQTRTRLVPLPSLVTYPNLMEHFKNLGVDMKLSDMSFSVSLDKGRVCEWGTISGLSSLFAQKMNVLSPYFWQMIREIINYLDELENNPDIDHNESLGKFIKSRGYSNFFLKAYLIPICASICSYSSEGVMGCSAFLVLSFCRNNHLLQVKEEFKRERCQIKVNLEVHLVSTSEKGCVVYCNDGSQELYDGCIMAVHANDALRMLGDEATYDERRILGAFQYANRVYQGYRFHEDGFQNSSFNKSILLLELLHQESELRNVSLHSKDQRSRSREQRTGNRDQRAEKDQKTHGEGAYWKREEQCLPLKFMTQADLGLADAYINEDFSFVDKDKGLLSFFLILATNNDSNKSNSKLKKNRAWWIPVFWTSALASTKFFMKHVLRRNTITQARKNISEHYDKAKIDKTHEVLDIGCGWGSLSIEVVKQTGCKYTGITLSTEQLKFAEKRVKDVGLQDHIKFLLCDYRQLPKTYKYDRIISCEMIEHVGHEYMEEFFGCCESILANDGVFVLQFISIRDQLYEEYRLSPGFMKEYIFPGGCMPSLSRITSAMAATSRLRVDNIESIGIHYYETLRRWRKNFLERQSEIMALGFDEKIIRTWEYYFDYCAAGFKSHILGDYQVVISRPNDVA